MTRQRYIGPNHRDGCDGSSWRHSGDDYNRVRVCACGAEDHDPSPESLEKWARTVDELLRDLRWRPKT